MVQRETSSEEPDLDFLLSGLGAQESGAEKGLATPGETLSPPKEKEEWDSLAPSSSASAEEEFEVPAAGSAEHTLDGDFGEDFFAEKEETSAPENKGSEFGEFSFDNEESQVSFEAAAIPETPPEKTGEFEFGEFPFDEESATGSVAPVAAPGIPSETDEFDFESDDFAAGESAEALSSEDFAGFSTAEAQEEGFTFGQEHTIPQADNQVMEENPEPSTSVEESFQFSDVAVTQAVGHEAENLPFADQDANKETEAVPTDFEEIDFGDTAASEPPMMKEKEIKPDKEFTPEPVAEEISPPAFVSLMPSAEEDLPPLAISTRKKGGSFFSIAVTTIAVLIVLTIGGVGFYVLKEGPTAFSKLGLSFLARWIGMDVAGERGITIKNPQGIFMVNREAGEIFVVTGEAVNNFKKPRASIQVKGTVLGSKGEILMQKTAYCGNVLSNEQLASLPMAKIEEAMGSPFGDSLANLDVQPGKSIPFVVVFNVVQKDAAEFSVEVAGSTVASQ